MLCMYRYYQICIKFHDLSFSSPSYALILTVNLNSYHAPLLPFSQWFHLSLSYYFNINHISCEKLTISVQTVYRWNLNYFSIVLCLWLCLSWLLFYLYSNSINFLSSNCIDIDIIKYCLWCYDNMCMYWLKTFLKIKAFLQNIIFMTIMFSRHLQNLLYNGIRLR